METHLSLPKNGAEPPIVLDGDPAPAPQKRHRAPNFRPIVAKWLHRSRCHLVWRQASAQARLCQMATQLPSAKRGHSPQLSAHVYCGQMAVCIRIQVGTEVGLSLGDTVLDGDPAPPLLKGHSPPPEFSANLRFGQTAGWPKMLLGMEVDNTAFRL